MQYSLLYSSNIVQHFSFQRMKLFQLEKKFSQKKQIKWPPFQSHQSHTYQINFFTPYLINIRCSLS